MPAVKPMTKRKYGGPQPNAGAPITVVIDWDQVDEWLEEQRSQKWIAKKLKCHPDTLKDRVKIDREAKDWSSYSEEKRGMVGTIYGIFNMCQRRMAIQRF